MAKQPKPKAKAKQGPPGSSADKVFKAPGMAFARGMGYLMNKTESAGKAIRSKIHKATAPAPAKPKAKKK